MNDNKQWYDDDKLLFILSVIAFILGITAAIAIGGMIYG